MLITERMDLFLMSLSKRLIHAKSNRMGADSTLKDINVLRDQAAALEGKSLQVTRNTTENIRGENEAKGFTCLAEV